jgi:arabinofuranan 3-O-arabinosyltransferase
LTQVRVSDLLILSSRSLLPGQYKRSLNKYNALGRWAMHDQSSPSRSILTASRLQAYGCAIAAIYLVFFVSIYRVGVWIVDSNGLPIYTDFACAWAATMQALHGDPAVLYDPAEFAKVQAALVAPTDYYYPNWPYPPMFFLFLAPFTRLNYLYGFITWDFVTLLGCIAVIYLIVRRLPAIALAVASPFTAWNFLAAHNGFLTASLLGAALLSLERWPVLAGVFIGCLTYKPQFGILFPVALAAANQWRAFASASATVFALAGISIAAFGTGVWQGLPSEFAAQTSEVFLAHGTPSSAAHWGYIQTIYGLVRLLGGNGAAAWLAQGLTTVGAAIIVWLVWRSSTRYALKAATLSAAALIATPYAFAYDMAAIAVPVAFLTRDQLRCGFLRGEQSIVIGVFIAIFTTLALFGDGQDGVTFGSLPLGPFVVVCILTLILRRALRSAAHPAHPHFEPHFNRFEVSLS